MHTLAQLAALIESASAYPLQEIRRAPQGVIAELATQTPDGQDARVGMGWALSELQDARQVEDLIQARTQEASASLERYVASFQAPAWDQQVWAD